ncbi:dihydrodipicolinate synthase/N-acetylneuraminate lyase [Nocardioides albertanoniae]|uniref:Dihydrodipicolinate synthase/N-acetylneuraminate lyase n=1 Tax=Nocardioides albertanoniae TaxID=1175486 RepID=A0A543ADB4_9ACTN|nr:dihydrodipicolinate synthase family protein [Nocardioides albertanoniae]TQL70572.1 dihydrodipicolinate synthase/N-acetylneuraminate lyase [Nocardioides albertanoniae]
MSAPLSAASLQGVWGSVLLPLRADDDIDWNRLEAEIRTLAASPLHGVYAHGTAGELHLLLDGEAEQVSRMLAAACAETGKPFQLGASHPVPQVTLERIARTRDLAPSAYQVALPDWLPLTDDECVAFVTRIAAAAAPIPLVLYNPGRATTTLTPQLLGRLLDETPSLIGVKVPGGGDAWWDELRTLGVLERCAVFVPGHRLASGLARGARGSYSNIAGLSPAGAARWYDLMTADPALAGDLERRIGEWFTRHVAPLQSAGVSDPALDKLLAAVGGWADIGLRVRWPYQSAPDSAVAAARDDARSLLPELFPALSVDTTPIGA